MKIGQNAIIFWQDPNVEVKMTNHIMYILCINDMLTHGYSFYCCHFSLCAWHFWIMCLKFSTWPLLSWYHARLILFRPYWYDLKQYHPRTSPSLVGTFSFWALQLLITYVGIKLDKWNYLNFLHTPLKLFVKLSPLFLGTWSFV